MTVILLDPLRPELLPLAAMKFVAGPVLVTEDIHPTTLWALQDAKAAPVGDDGDPLTVLVSTDRTHPLVRTRVDRGEIVIGVSRHTGDALIEAVALMDNLRRNGPWESQQTHDSLRRYLLEEVYELLDAIDVGTQTDLREELGDLLLQVLFHARIAADDADAPFDIDDVARSFVAKVSHRTPGILSGEHRDLQTQIREWEERKAAEKQRGSVLDGIATTAPALALAQKVLERLAAAGFPKPEVDTELLSVTIDVGGRSTEDVTRQRVLDLMDRVYAAEESATAAGEKLRTPQAWLHHLGVADGYATQDDSHDAGSRDGETQAASPSAANDVDGDAENHGTQIHDVDTHDVERPDDDGQTTDESPAERTEDELTIDDYYGSESLDSDAPNVVPRSESGSAG